MKRFLSSLILVLAISFAPGNLISAAEPKTSGLKKAPNVVVSLTGKLTAVEGKLFVAKDRTGQEFQIHVDKVTSVIGTPRPGVWIEAKIFVGTGQVEVIKVLESS